MAAMTRSSLNGSSRVLVVAALALAVAGSCVSLEAFSKAASAPASRQSPVAQLPPQPADGITFVQITEGRPLDLSQSGGRLGFVWSGHAKGGAVGSRYYPQDRDFDRSHTVQWYAQHAPDQVVYKCDRKSPAPLYTYYWGYNAPLDTANPAVRAYILNTYVIPAIRSGQKVIALDNVGLLNEGKRCGVYRNGQWVQLFTGEARDPAYAQAVLNWVDWLAHQIHAHGGLLALNAKVDPNDVPATRKLISLGDIWLEEAGFTRDCKPRVADRNWQVKMQLSQWAASRMPWISVEKSCASPASLSADEAQWIVGNFLLAKTSQSYLGVIHDGDPRMVLRYPPTLNPPVGIPQGPAFTIAGGGLARRFSGGLVIVNPSSAARLDYELPRGRWVTLAGAPVSGRLTLGPTSAIVLRG
jgi:hypothetical protein